MDLDCLKATKADASHKVAFVFTGQGAQYPQMGKELLTYPCYKDNLLDSEKQPRILGCPWSLTGK